MVTIWVSERQGFVLTVWGSDRERQVVKDGNRVGVRETVHHGSKMEDESVKTSTQHSNVDRKKQSNNQQRERESVCVCVCVWGGGL
jgi:hypothetical protein